MTPEKKRITTASMIGMTGAVGLLTAPAAADIVQVPFTHEQTWTPGVFENASRLLDVDGDGNAEFDFQFGSGEQFVGGDAFNPYGWSIRPLSGSNVLAFEGGPTGRERFFDGEIIGPDSGSAQMIGSPLTGLDGARVRETAFLDAGGKAITTEFGELFSPVETAIYGLAFSVGGDTHYGWIMASLLVDDEASGGVVTVGFGDFYYESEAGQAIAAGTIPGPGALALLALGGLGAGRRTRES